MLPAKNIQFSWAYLFMAIDSNILLLIMLSLVSLTWLRTRRDLEATMHLMCWFLQACLCCVDSFSVLLSRYGITEVNVLAFKGLVAATGSFLSYSFVTSHNKDKRN
eukprot:UN20496